MRCSSLIARMLPLLVAVLSVMMGCGDGNRTAVSEKTETAVTVDVLPVSGTFLNLAYQDVRNKYTNPPYMDYTDPCFWYSKVGELNRIGIEYLVIMAVANEGKAYYPSDLMPWHYPSGRQSPVDAIMDAAAEYDMKVFMSTGWAYDQDDNLKIPRIKNRQVEMMTELASIYGSHKAMYGWYLPVEDCLGPVLSDYAVEAVNALTDKARSLTPDLKILISPYGIFNSDFEDPEYERQLSRIKVDIIAYQDEIGCVREKYPLPRLRENWKRLRLIHDRTGVEMWANCESFAWEGNTNDRSSALVPASFSRFLSQMVTASAGGVDRIISFMFYGIYEDPDSDYMLGQPFWSGKAYSDYVEWMKGGTVWKASENAFAGRYGEVAVENPEDPRWCHYGPGHHDVLVEVPPFTKLESLLVRMLSCEKDGIMPPEKLSLSLDVEGQDSRLISVKNCPVFPNTRHDAYVDCVLFESLDIEAEDAPFNLRLSFDVNGKSAFDRVILNPEI